MGLSDKIFSDRDKKQEEPGLYGDANRWRTIDESNTALTRDPDIMYTGRAFRIPEA
jgi:hypothetical protein